MVKQAQDMFPDAPDKRHLGTRSLTVDKLCRDHKLNPKFVRNLYRNRNNRYTPTEEEMKKWGYSEDVEDSDDGSEDKEPDDNESDEDSDEENE